MRVQEPAKYAEVLLSIALPNAGYTAQRIRSMYGTAEQNINFPAPIPVHITYQTAFVDDAGELQIRPDIYGIDTKTRNLIRSERGVVEPHAGAWSGGRQQQQHGRQEQGPSKGAAAPGRLLRAAVRWRQRGAAATRRTPGSASAELWQRPPLRGPLFPQANYRAGPVNSRLAIRITAATFRHSPPVAI